MPAYSQIASVCAALATAISLPVHAQATRLPAALDFTTLDSHVREASRTCQSAFNRDPLSARKRDPLAEMLGG